MKSNKIKKINKFELQSIYILLSSCIIQIVFKEESKMDFEKVKQDIIRKIVIGPKTKVTIEDVVDFLNFCGYYENVEGGYNSTTPICVRKSITSYR